MNYRCPVCFFDRLPYPPEDYHICVCCGTEFGNDDLDQTHEELLRAWIANGAPWFYEHSPAGWNPWHQIMRAGRADLVRAMMQIALGSTWENERPSTENLYNETLPIMNAEPELALT